MNRERNRGRRFLRKLLGYGTGLWLILSAVVPGWGQGSPSRSLATKSRSSSERVNPASPTLKSLTEVVNVPVTVRDSDEELVPGLKLEDFNLTEDGSNQTIKYFSLTRDAPLTLGLMVDTTVCQDEALPLEKELAQEFIRQVMQANDQVFVMHFGSEVAFEQHLTGDEALIMTSIDNLQIEPHTASWERPHRGHKFDRGPHHIYDAIVEGAQEIGKSQAGMKVLLLLTDGYEQDSRASQKQALEAASRAGAMIYCINLQDPILGTIPEIGTAGRPLLLRLTGQTGGKLFWLGEPRDLPPAFNELADELRSDYFVGYTPTNLSHDGTYRKIQVTVKEKGYAVRARPGYYAPND